MINPHPLALILAWQRPEEGVGSACVGAPNFVSFACSANDFLAASCSSSLGHRSTRPSAFTTRRLADSIASSSSPSGTEISFQLQTKYEVRLRAITKTVESTCNETRKWTAWYGQRHAVKGHPLEIKKKEKQQSPMWRIESEIECVDRPRDDHHRLTERPQTANVGGFGRIYLGRYYTSNDSPTSCCDLWRRHGATYFFGKKKFIFIDKNAPWVSSFTNQLFEKVGKILKIFWKFLKVWRTL